MIHIKLAEDVMDYIYDVQAQKKKEKKSSVYSIQKAIEAITRDHMAFTGYIPKTQNSKNHDAEPSV